MAKLFYVSQVVEDPQKGKGVLSFTTEDETKARSEAAIDPAVRFLLAFEDGQLIESSQGTPDHVLAQVSAKEARRFKFEKQAAAVD